MTNFRVWYRNPTDGRAPEDVFLYEDYTHAGDIDAASVRDLQQKVQTTTAEESGLQNHRTLATGDVVQDGDRFYILTPLGIWATVQAFLD